MTKQQYTFYTAHHPPQCLSSSNTNANAKHPVFADAMHVRTQVFIVEQHCSPEGENDEDDARSWQWVVYARVQNQHQNENENKNPDNNTHDNNDNKGIPVGVIRLVPPPHAPHEHLTNPGKAQQQKFDYAHEPYVKITRVAVLKDFRGYGLARLLMRVVEEWAQENKRDIDDMYAVAAAAVDGGSIIRSENKNEWRGLIGLHAQVQVEKMYAGLGYETDASMGRWDEEGIEHVGMFKRVAV